jgi:hypothetical protein
MAPVFVLASCETEKVFPHSTPVDGGSWHCARHDWTLTQDQQRVGCAAHLMIPALVPGEQVDAGDDWVSYQMRDGSEWRDGVPA